jgi:hypothetical protein
VLAVAVNKICSIVRHSRTFFSAGACSTLCHR